MLDDYRGGFELNFSLSKRVVYEYFFLILVLLRDLEKKFGIFNGFITPKCSILINNLS